MHLIFGQSGGTGSKESLQVYVKNTLAGSLLEQGFPLQWTASTVDQIIATAGMKPLTQIVAMPAGQARLDQILQTCRNCSITIPDRVAQDAAKVVQRGNQNQRDKKRQVIQPNPSHYELELAYLRNEDGSIPSQLPEVSVSNSGHHKFETRLATQQCTLPCTDANGKAVILAATLCHLGEKKIQPVSDTKHVDEQRCTTVALTLWRDDWNDSDWAKIGDQTFVFIKQLLVAQNLDKAVESMWGRSMRGDQKKQTSALHALSVQVHASVQQDRTADFLKASGFCKLYATPKGSDGRPATHWRIIWVQGDKARLHALATETVNCAGLVRSKQSWGLRYLNKDFEPAWKHINGDKPVPIDFRVCHLFRVEPLPYGATADMLHSWSSVLQWPFKAIKALGARSWLIGSEQMPPAGIHTFNSSPVLIKYLPPRGVAKEHPVLAGPRPTKKDQVNAPAEDPWGPFFDPWHKSSRAAPASSNIAQGAAPTRALQGPTEAKFQAQEERIHKIEASLQELQQQQVALRSETEKGFAQVAANEKQLHQAITQVRTDLDSSFTSAIASQSQQLNRTLDDLKALIIAKSKRKADEDDQMES
eukprot:Skav229427  [mRNA]  locus=scaffold2297:344990:346853:+ [translate_table: standard]